MSVDNINTDFASKMDDKGFQCEKCKKVLSSLSSLKIHLGIHSDYRPYSCQSCTSTFKDPSAFGRHKKLHLENQQEYSCDVCQKVLSSYSNLYNHKKTHSDERKFICMECKITFKTKRRLTDHEYRSHGNHVFECDLCN